MTNGEKEKAIAYFEWWKSFNEHNQKAIPKDTIAYKAYQSEIGYYDMAIKALEQEPRWIPVKTINQCYIPELKDYHGKVIATYLTGKHIKPQVTTISISYGRIENKKYTDIVAIMYLPEPYREVEE